MTSSFWKTSDFCHFCCRALHDESLFFKKNLHSEQRFSKSFFFKCLRSFTCRQQSKPDKLLPKNEQIGYMSSFSVELTNGEHARSNYEHPQPPTGRKDFPLLNFKVTLATTPVDRNGGFERTTEKRKKKISLLIFCESTNLKIYIL